MPPAPPLTKAEWLKRKDRGKSYEAYRALLRTRRRPAPVAPDPYPGYMTEAEQIAAAKQAATDALLPGQQELQRQQAETERRTRERAQYLQQLSLAEAELLKGTGAQVQGGYDLASQRQQTIAQGYSEGFKLAMGETADDTNAFLAKQGAPAGQMVGNQPAQSGADVLYGLGGALPATDLNTQGAAFGAAARMLPQTALGRGQANIRETFRESDAAQADIDRQLRDLAAQHPGLYRQALQQFQQNQQGLAGADRMATIQERAMTLNEAISVANLGVKAGDINRPDASLSRVYGHVVDSNGRMLPGPDGQPIKVAKTGAGATPGAGRAKAIGKRESAKSTARKTVFALAQDSLGAPRRNPDPASLRNPGNYVTPPMPPKYPNGKGTNDPNEAAWDARKTWRQMMTLSFSAVADDLRRYGIRDSEIRKLVRQRLLAAGFRPPKRKQKSGPPAPGRGAAGPFPRGGR